MDPSAMYAQHEWSPITWALMLIVMIIVVFAAISVWLIASFRISAASASRPETPPIDETQAPEVRPARPLVPVP